VGTEPAYYPHVCHSVPHFDGKHPSVAPLSLSSEPAMLGPIPTPSRVHINLSSPFQKVSTTPIRSAGQLDTVHSGAYRASIPSPPLRGQLLTTSGTSCTIQAIKTRLSRFDRRRENTNHRPNVNDRQRSYTVDSVKPSGNGRPPGTERRSPRHQIRSHFESRRPTNDENGRFRPDGLPEF
jgi:hypothetical protein